MSLILMEDVVVVCGGASVIEVSVWLGAPSACQIRLIQTRKSFPRHHKNPTLGGGHFLWVSRERERKNLLE